MRSAVFISEPPKSVRPALMRLWKTVFGDSDKYISLFFERRFSPERCVAAMCGGEPVGMIHLLPLQIRQGGRHYPASYIYAVAVHPDFRRRGISGDMLAFAHQKLKNEGAALSMLTPANPPLFDYYSARGFETEFYKREPEITPDYAGVLPALSPVSLADMAALRGSLFSASPLFADWSSADLDYQQRENSLFGGETLYFSSPAEGYALCLPVNGGVFIREWGANGLYPGALAAIAARYNAKKLRLRLPAKAEEPDAAPFAMTCRYTLEREAPGESPAVISLVLD